MTELLHQIKLVPQTVEKKIGDFMAEETLNSI